VGLLNELGVAPPKTFPSELERLGSKDAESACNAIEQNPYSELILKIYQSYAGVFSFHEAYVSHLIDDNDLGLGDTDAHQIAFCLMDLAASKIEINEKFAPRFSAFSSDIRRLYTEWLTLAKEKASRAGIPLRAELMDMVHDTSDSLAHTAEAEVIGANSLRLHPDIYMNELLIGMRTTHKMLLAIMEKLGIGEGFEQGSS
jgi:hypothetical protein